MKLVARASLTLTASGLNFPVVVGCIGLRFLWGGGDEDEDWSFKWFAGFVSIVCVVCSMLVLLWRMKIRMMVMMKRAIARSRGCLSCIVGGWG